MSISNGSLKNLNIVNGRRINLRLVQEKDAEFILSLRLNPALNRFIGFTSPSLEIQREWINHSIANLNDYMFIVEDKNGIPNGTIAIYNVDFERGLAEWGRWIMKPNSSMYFSIESNILALYFAFEKLKLKKLIGGNNNKNYSSIKFHSMYATITSIDNLHTWYEIENSNYQKALILFKAYHKIEY